MSANFEISQLRNSCDLCTRAQREPAFSRYRAQCRGCGIRQLAQSPLFTAGGLDGSLAAPYRRALAAVFGHEWRAGHEEVKCVRAVIHASRSLL